jgi:peptidyl-prolyl cis-trans isomerase SurA
MMPSARLKSGLLACGLVVAAFAAAPQPARAQVVALINGTPVTELDITQRTKIVRMTTGKSLGRKEILQQLVDDQLKIFIAKRYQVDVSNDDVQNAFAGMAQRSHLTAEQMEQSLSKQGISVTNLKLKIRADLDWNNMVRGRFSSSLQVNEADVRHALQARGDTAKDNTGYSYTLYPITLVAPRGADLAGRRSEAENLRGRFQSCKDGLKLARSLRAVVVREPVHRTSADLAPQLREILDKLEVGKLTAPEITPQGIQMFALCERKESASDSPAKKAIREEIFMKRFEAESKKYLEEVRRQSMIEYR